MRRQRGQSTVEFAITFAAITMPLTAAIIFTAQLLWVWHSVVEFTRDGAQYAVTHCYHSSADNVTNYMRLHVPPNVDSAQFSQGSATIEVQYFQRNSETGQLEQFQCPGAECSTECVPDAVTVRVAGYEFLRGLSYFGVRAPLPDFRTSMPVESAGCQTDGTCVE